MFILQITAITWKSTTTLSDKSWKLVSYGYILYGIKIIYIEPKVHFIIENKIPRRFSSNLGTRQEVWLFQYCLY